MKKFLIYSAIIIALIAGFFFLSQKFVEQEQNVVVEDNIAQTTIANIYFVQYTQGHKPVMVPVKRKILKDNISQNTINALLSGPNTNEQNKGLVSEIPKKTKLLNVAEYEDMVIVNLSGGFASGAGTDSVTTRLQQVINTVSDMTDIPVYLYVNGKELSVLGGDGIIVKQPVNMEK